MIAGINPSNCFEPIKVSNKLIFLIVLIVLGILTSAIGQSQTPTPEIIKLYNQAVATKDYKKSAQYAYEIAKYYSETKDLNKALDYLNQSLAHAKKAADNPMLYNVYNQLGTRNMELKQYNKALEYFQSALSIGKQLADATMKKDALLNVAINYAYSERYKKAIEYTDEALALAIDQTDLPLQEKCYQLLAEYYTKQKNTKKAAEYKAQYNLMERARQFEEQKKQTEELKKREVKALEKHIEEVGLENEEVKSQMSEQSKKIQIINDSLHMVEDSLHVATDSLKAVEEISKSRMLEIDLLHKDKELADFKIKEQEVRIQNEALVRNFIIVGTLLSVALIIVLVISYRKKTKANEKIDQQNKNIKSSINYAKRIQEAMLPKVEQHPEIFEKSFILFKPRDTVSGDFYWLSDLKSTQQNSDIAFAAVDCTGHGVPGAFMSMIGINALNGIINRGITETNKILDSLDHEIRTALRQEVSGNNDGMDIALCIYRQSKKILEYSGAKNPLVYVQDTKLFQVKGDIHSIGGSKNKNQFFYKKHEILIDKPTVIYLFSDGYKDQFGGKDNGKFMSKKLNNLLLDIHFLPMKEQLRILQTTIETWKGTHDQTDDILVMGLKLETH